MYQLIVHCCAVDVAVYFLYRWFFFFKQKTAYEMLRSLVGSEMCIRDRRSGGRRSRAGGDGRLLRAHPRTPAAWGPDRIGVCLLYTSDAADDLLCVDLGGRRIIKKKKQNTIC